MAEGSGDGQEGGVIGEQRTRGWTVVNGKTGERVIGRRCR
jgi:hypothetical protein